jgi:hypothetical protein
MVKEKKGNKVKKNRKQSLLQLSQDFESPAFGLRHRSPAKLAGIKRASCVYYSVVAYFSRFGTPPLPCVGSILR